MGAMPQVWSELKIKLHFYPLYTECFPNILLHLFSLSQVAEYKIPPFVLNVTETKVFLPFL